MKFLCSYLGVPNLNFGQTHRKNVSTQNYGITTVWHRVQMAHATLTAYKIYSGHVQNIFVIYTFLIIYDIVMFISEQKMLCPIQGCFSEEEKLIIYKLKLKLLVTRNSITLNLMKTCSGIYFKLLLASIGITNFCFLLLLWA